MSNWTAALLASVALLPITAHAQAASENVAEEAVPGEIIVTAQRVEQRAQDVPLSLAVVGSEEIDRRGVTDLKDLQYSVPGLSSYEYGVGTQIIQLRGVTNLSGSSTIAMYFDETPLDLGIQGETINVRLLDMERVEILRGPQATLYGQGSMGGTIRYIPAAPDLGNTTGSASGEYSSTQDGERNFKATGMINVPFSTDKAGLRVVAGYERIGGFIDNVALDQEDSNRSTIYTVRGSLLIRPTEQLSVSLIGLYQQAKQRNQDFGLDRRTSALVPTPVKIDYTLIQGRIAYDFDAAQLSASASYIDRDSASVVDISSFYVPALIAPPPFGFGFPVGFIDRISLVNDIRYKIFNSEVRLASISDGPFGWQLGATYRDLKNESRSTTATAPNLAPFDILATAGADRNKSYSVYGEVSYAITPQLKAIAGVRYFNEQKRRINTTTNFGFTTTDIGDDTFDTINPRFNMSYEITPNSLVFVNVAKGFRSGGFNATSAGGPGVVIPPSYDPDEIWTYELGTKHQLFGNKLILDASIYRSEWSRVQSYAFAPGSAITITTNSGEVSGWGADFSATARPIRDLTLTATYGWNNLAFDKVTADKAKGDPVDGAIRESWSASLDYRPALTSEIGGIFRIDYQHAGKGQIIVRNFVPPITTDRPAHDLVNLRIGAAFGRFELALFANNLFDDDTPSLVGPFGVIAENVEQRPRVIGLSASASF